MRLTLRTMLAYMDEILDPADQEEIGKKIEQSERASEILHLTRDVMRRLRLGSPQLSGKGMGLDPNTVAEYLDNTLSPERMADFERVCLESEVHLAEVAASHQILTLVLGEPADIDSETRRKMYDIPQNSERLLQSRLDSPHTLTTETPEPSASEPVQAKESTAKRRHPAEVPEYLRKSRGSRLLKAATVLVLAASLVGVAVFMTHPEWLRDLVGRYSPVAKQDGDSSEGQTEQAVVDGLEQDRAQSAESPDAGISQEPEIEALVENKPQTPTGEQGAPVVVEPVEGGLLNPAEPAKIAKVPEPSLQQPTVTERPNGAPMGEATDPTGQERVDPVTGLAMESQPSEPSVEASPLAPPPSAAGPGLNPPGLNAPSLNALAEATPEDSSVPESPSPESMVANPDADLLPGIDSPPAAEAEPAATRMGTLVAKEQVLLRSRPEQPEWIRLGAMEPLMAGDQLLALPTYRPVATMSDGSFLTLIDGTQVELVGMEESNLVRLKVLRGRLLVKNTKPTEITVRIGLSDGQQLEVQLEGDASLAIAVSRVHTLGANPEDSVSPVMVQLFAVEGLVRPIEAAGPRDVQAPADWSFRDGAFSFPDKVAALPDWISSARNMSPIERNASDFVSRELEIDQPAELRLQELADPRGPGNQDQVRSLAARSSLYIGRYGLFISALKDEEIPPAWRPKLIVALRDAMLQDPAAAASIKVAFHRESGEQIGQKIYRMMWGYSAEDLQQGADRELVEALRDNRLDIRLLAYWNLAEATRLDSFVTRQLGDPLKNGVDKRWQKRLSDGKIIHQATKAPTP